MNVQQRVNEIIARHCIWMAETIVQIEHLLRPDDMPSVAGSAELREMRELVHQMTGSSGTVGFAEIGQTAARLEDHLVELIERGTDKVSEPDQSQLKGAFRDLASLIARARPKDSSLYRIDAA